MRKLTFDNSPAPVSMIRFIDAMPLGIWNRKIEKKYLARIRDFLLSREWLNSFDRPILYHLEQMDDGALKASRATLMKMIFNAYVASLNEKHPMGPVCFCGVGLEHSQNRKNIAPP